MGPTWGPPGTVSPRWAPCWSHEPCYQGCVEFPHLYSANHTAAEQSIAGRQSGHVSYPTEGPTATGLWLWSSLSHQRLWSYRNGTCCSGDNCCNYLTDTHPLNSLWPSDATWRHGSGSTLAQVMACCLTAPSHYLNQCWLIISKVHWHSHEGNFTRDTSAINH